MKIQEWWARSIYWLSGLIGNAICLLLTPALRSWCIHHYCPHQGYVLWQFRTLNYLRDSKQPIHTMIAAVLLEIDYSELRQLDDYDDNNYVIYRTSEEGWSVSDSPTRILRKTTLKYFV